MPQVGVNNEPLLERLVFAYDGTNYRVVKCDTSGNLVAGLVAGSSIEVTQATAANLKMTATLAADQNVQARGYGWVGGAWQKNAILDGYSGVASESVSQVLVTGGTKVLTGTTVPAGEIWELQAAHIEDNTTSVSQAIIQVVSSGVTVSLMWSSSGGAGKQFTWTGVVTLEPGDKVQAVFVGTVAGDTISLAYTAKRTDIDQ